MSKFKCECGNDSFKASATDEYWFEVDIDKDKFMTVKVVDTDRLGDVECLTSEMVCDKCGKKADFDYEDYEWDWSGNEWKSQKHI